MKAITLFSFLSWSLLAAALAPAASASVSATRTDDFPSPPPKLG